MLSCSWSLYKAVGVGRDNDILILCMSRPAANNNAGPEGTITGGRGPGADQVSRAPPIGPGKR